MKTQVLMKRKLFGQEITQQSKTEMFSATDLVRSGNKWRIENGLEIFNHKNWFQQKNVKEFVAELEKEFGKVKISGRGNKSHTWVHPLLFIDLALAISPKLKIEVYTWLYDSLLSNRNDSGDSYKKMCGSLYVHSINKSEYPRYISKVALKIKQVCNVDDWQKASDEQLKLRDKLHNNIALISNVLRDNDKAVEYGINEAMKVELK